MLYVSKSSFGYSRYGRLPAFNRQDVYYCASAFYFEVSDCNVAIYHLTINRSMPGSYLM
jgi:hypothetical protein